jgi:hypothetical protein
MQVADRRTARIGFAASLRTDTDRAAVFTVLLEKITSAPCGRHAQN